MNGESERVRGDQGDWRPRPDPTDRTTSALFREIAALRELMEARLDAEKQIYSERFVSVERQLALVESQRVEQKADTKNAVDAALTAQKEAVREQTLASEKAIAKSDASTTKQLDQLAITFNTAINAVSESLSDVKGKVTVLESIKLGVQEKREGISAAVALASTAIFITIAVITVVLTIVSK